MAAALLDYRHLGAARAAAQQAGYQGAMFPWQSGSNGREETQQLHEPQALGRWLPDHSQLQRHVNIAIAYNVWEHYLITAGNGFLRFVGAELLIEIARFWAGLATWNAKEGRYEIRGVMGPDDYEAYPGRRPAGLNNNTYTNVMAVWVLRIPGVAGYPAAPLPGAGRRSWRSVTRSWTGWRDISRKMKLVVFHADSVLTQFEGYEQLLEFDWEGYRERYGNIARLGPAAGGGGRQHQPLQAGQAGDVLMLLFLLSRSELRELLAGLGYQVSDEQLARTVDYYLQRTCTGRPFRGGERLAAGPATSPSRPGGSSSRRWRATSPTSRAAPPPRASTWARWPAPSTWCCAAWPACGPAVSAVV